MKGPIKRRRAHKKRQWRLESGDVVGAGSLPAAFSARHNLCRVSNHVALLEAYIVLEFAHMLRYDSIHAVDVENATRILATSVPSQSPKD